ncbi:hypothetical protein [Streptomyces sp. SLBN-118]|uniref:hypothetical protein n=1 Tax=Streptomyces sp. SLBN-118 TaxID=2768454 RepID=UPI001151C648|nr:hypothetical protein [Streptomyces sp. SLBN-118]
MDPRGHGDVPYAALLVASWLEPERGDLDAVVARAGRCSRAAMVICSAATVAATVVLAVAGRLA